MLLVSSSVMKMCAIQSSLFLFLLVEAATKWSGGQHQGSTFWVAPTVAECIGKPKCNTLAGYQGLSPTIFSTSNATWIFMWGTHQMLPTPIVVFGARNITWTGGPGCTPRHCQVLQFVNDSTLCSYVRFEGCQGVFITQLGFANTDAGEGYSKPCDNLKLAQVDRGRVHLLCNAVRKVWPGCVQGNREI